MLAIDTSGGVESWMEKGKNMPATLKTCRWCKSEVDARAKFCPHCGQVLKGARTLTVILLIVLFIAIVVSLATLKKAGLL